MSVAVQACEDKPVAGHSWVKKIGKRNLLIAGAVLLIGAAVCLNWVFFAGGTQKRFDGFDQGTQVGGNTQSGVGDKTDDGSQTTGTGGEDSVSTDSYFSTVQLSRQKAREEALEVLQSVVDGATSNGEEEVSIKTEALTEIREIAEEMKKEADIESLLLSRGFKKCVVVLNGDQASVIVKSGADGFGTTQLSQINAIVYEQTGISPAGITVIERK